MLESFFFCVGDRYWCEFIRDHDTEVSKRLALIRTKTRVRTVLKLGETCVGEDPALQKAPCSTENQRDFVKRREPTVFDLYRRNLI